MIYNVCIVGFGGVLGRRGGRGGLGALPGSGMGKLVRGGGFGISVLVAAGPNSGGRGWVSVFQGLSASVGGAFGLPGGGGVWPLGWHSMGLRRFPDIY